MNPVGELRESIKKSLRKVDQNFSEHLEPFSTENIGALKANEIFHVDIATQDIAYETSSNTREFTLPSQLTVVTKGGTNAIDKRDQLVCNVMEFILNITSKVFIQGTNFYDIKVNSLDMERLGDNNQWSKAIVNLEHRIKFNQD